MVLATRDVMLGWWIHLKLAEATMEDLESPDTCVEWIEEFRGYSLTDVYTLICKEYPAFRKTFDPPKVLGDDTFYEPHEVRGEPADEEVIF